MDKIFSVLEDFFGVMEALRDISEALSVKSSLKDTSNDLLKFLHVICRCDISVLILVWLSESSFLRLNNS